MRTRINQSLIDWVEWNENNTMLVAFDSGKVAEYRDIPAGIERGLIQAPSPGSYFNRYIRGVFRYVIVTDEIPTIAPEQNLKQLQHEYDSTRGLWCIDKNLKEADIDWIRENSFQLTNTIGAEIKKTGCSKCGDPNIIWHSKMSEAKVCQMCLDDLTAEPTTDIGSQMADCFDKMLDKVKSK